MRAQNQRMGRECAAGLWWQGVSVCIATLTVFVTPASVSLAHPLCGVRKVFIALAAPPWSRNVVGGVFVRLHKTSQVGAAIIARRTPGTSAPVAVNPPNLPCSSAAIVTHVGTTPRRTIAATQQIGPCVRSMSRLLCLGKLPPKITCCAC